MTENSRADAIRERIAERSELNAFIALTNEYGAGPVVAVKDLIDVRGTVTTGGSAPDGLEPARADARVIANLRESGGVIIGKANLYEWGYGVSSDNLHHGAVRNPIDPDRSAGGSSSGSAAAVAAGLCDWAIGTDTAGSVRIPASLCGVVGFKPSRGSIPLDGVVELSPSQDTIGVLAPSVATAWLAAGSLAPEMWPRGTWRPLAGARPRLAVPAGWVDDLDLSTQEAWDRIAPDLPRIDYVDREELFRLGETIQAFEAARVHGDALARAPQRYRPEVRERIERGNAISGIDYRDALTDRSRLTQLADRALAGWDALVLPTTACVAPPLDEPEPREQLTRFTRPLNVTGQPVFTIPVATPGLPVGLQIVGRDGEDARLAQLAAALWEEVRPRAAVVESASRGELGER